MRHTISAAQIFRFSRSWPCHGLPIDEGVSLAVEFDAGGNLVDLAWSDGRDYWECETSGALLALIEDAKAGQLS